MTYRKYQDLFRRLFHLAVILALCPLTLCVADENDVEKALIIESAKSYFDAELSGDPKAVWAALAPSSVFKRQYSFDDYLEIQSKNEIAVKNYEVVEVLEIMENNDLIVLPGVDKLAAVKVHVKLGAKNGKESEHDNIFVFLKENGKWFKG